MNILTQENIGNVTFGPAIVSGTTDLINIVAEKESEDFRARFMI